MERLERQLSTNMALLAIIGAVMLGLGQQDAKLALLVFIGAVASVVYTDRRKKFSLNHHLANVAALCAVGLALFDYSASDRNQQLLAIANLLVYLQVVVFFQEKNARIFGQLAMLSLLQVVVAAALNYSILFGVLIVVYMAIGLPTLSLFFFYRELGRFVPRAAEETGASSPPGSHPTEAEPARPRGAKPRRRWPLAAREATFVGADFKPQEEAFGRGGLLAFTTRMACFTLLLTLIVFIFAPRLGRTPWQAGTIEATRIVGYSEEVSLGELGSAVENPETVMRVAFVDEETQAPIHLSGSPLFRGSVVASYDLETRRWSQYREGYGADPHQLHRVQPGMRHLTRQDIKLEPLSESAVFSVFPVFATDPETCLIRYDENTKQLFREDRDKDQTIKFSLWTTGIQNYVQTRILPAGAGLSQKELNILRRVPAGHGASDPFAGLKQVADDAIARAGIDGDDHFLVARELEQYLLNGGNYKYSIEAQQRPNPQVDPIEDFVTRGRVGHCEYFASALALMLRHRGIACRVVIGFKGGDWNSLGNYYQVRQLHAHAWVEAFFKRNQLADHGIELGPNDFAAWLTLDPTADLLAGDQQQASGLWAKIRSVGDYMQMQWITYVVGLTREQQREHIYKPLAEAYQSAKEKWEAGSEAGGRRQSFRLLVWLKQLTGGEWFSWRGLLVTVALLLFLSAAGTLFVLAGRWLWKWARRRWPGAGRGEHGRTGPEVAFYRQLETILARHGQNRQPGQTQREFAASAARSLSAGATTEPVSQLPRAVVEAFYAVRFGGRALDSGQVEAVDAALAELKASLTTPAPRNAAEPRPLRAASRPR